MTFFAFLASETCSIAFWNSHSGSSFYKAIIDFLNLLDKIWTSKYS